MFRETLSWLVDYGYITVQPPVSGVNDDYRIRLTEKAFAVLGAEPVSLNLKTTLGSKVKSAAKAGTAEACSTVIQQIAIAGVSMFVK